MNKTIRNITAALATGGALVGMARGIGHVQQTYARASQLEQQLEQSQTQLRQEKESITSKPQIVEQTGTLRVSVLDGSGNGLYDIIEIKRPAGTHLIFKQGEHGPAQSLSNEYTMEYMAPEAFNAKLENYFAK